MYNTREMIRQNILKFIPPRTRFKLVSIKHTFTKFKQTHYAQNCEDVMLRSLFPANYKGFYIDVGAHHPYRISNTFLLFKSGWSGVNIDANPETISLYRKARPNDINLNIGVGLHEETLSYYRFSDPAVNTFVEEAAEKFKNKSWIEYLGTTKIQVVTLETILNQHVKPEQVIDVLSVDVEGFDLDVLKSNDWRKFRPKVIVVEAHDFNLEKMNEHPIYQFLHEKGYALKFVMKFSLIFVENTKSS